jgi:CheY-like chemotaxis protein
VTLRCLVVDDNPSFLDEAVALLEREGLTVAGIASTVEGALLRAHELQPDVVLVDIMLGEESGFELARRLAAADSGRPAVILVSTLSEADFEELIADAPVAGFVAKSELSALAIRRLVA